MESKKRLIQEYVPGKQITLCHIIANPDVEIYSKLGLVDDNNKAIGILTMTPSETAIIAADLATKSAYVKVGFVDRFSGSVIIIGEVGEVEASLKDVIDVFINTLKYPQIKVTKT
ncbi:MAG TPA: propanediol utilization protein [Clostridiales bacterium]|nr:propanediol utilization protein [Clostridiales bacterium]